MSYRAIVAHDDVLRRPNTRLFVTPASIEGPYLGGPNNPASALSSDDLGEMTVIYSGQANVTLRWQFFRPLPIAVVSVLNVRCPTTVPTQNSAVTLSAFLTLGGATQASTSLVFTQRPQTPLDVDRHWVPASPVTADALRIDVVGPAVGLAIGRVFAATGLSFAGGTEGGLQEGWSVTIEDGTAPTLGITGAARPQPAATGRILRFQLTGISDAAALGTPAAATYGGPIIEPAYGLQDLQLRAGQSRPVLALIRANAAAPALHRYAAFGPLAEPLTLSREDGAPTWTAGFAVAEVNR